MLFLQLHVHNVCPGPFTWAQVCLTFRQRQFLATQAVSTPFAFTGFSQVNLKPWYLTTFFQHQPAAVQGCACRTWWRWPRAGLHPCLQVCGVRSEDPKALGVQEDWEVLRLDVEPEGEHEAGDWEPWVSFFSSWAQIWGEGGREALQGD